MLYYRCEPGPQQATAHSADDLNSRPALTVSAPEREREMREREREREREHSGTAQLNLHVSHLLLEAASTTDARCVFVCVAYCVFLIPPFFFLGSNSYQRACSSFHSRGGHHTGSGPTGCSCWIPAQWTVRLKKTREKT